MLKEIKKTIVYYLKNFLLPQIKSVENDFILREQNRQYLDSQIGGIDGFVPMDLIPGSRSSNHLYR